MRLQYLFSLSEGDVAHSGRSTLCVGSTSRVILVFTLPVFQWLCHGCRVALTCCGTLRLVQIDVGPCLWVALHGMLLQAVAGCAQSYLSKAPRVVGTALQAQPAQARSACSAMLFSAQLFFCTMLFLCTMLFPCTMLFSVQCDVLFRTYKAFSMLFDAPPRAIFFLCDILRFIVLFPCNFSSFRCSFSVQCLFCARYSFSVQRDALFRTDNAFPARCSSFSCAVRCSFSIQLFFCTNLFLRTNALCTVVFFHAVRCSFPHDSFSV